MRLFVDANVLFSAAAPLSATARLFEAAGKYATLVTNPHAWEEAHRNLLLKRPAMVTRMSELEKRLELSNAWAPVRKFDLPPEDIPILAGAKGARCTHLWTGDKKHFGRWYANKLEGIMIISSLQLADLLIEMGWNRA